MKNGNTRKFFKNSIMEGGLSQVFLNIAGPNNPFITKLLTSLNASPIQLSLLQIAVSIAQFSQIGAPLISKNCKSRKFLAVILHAVSRLLIIPMALLPLLFYGNGQVISLILAVYFVSAVCTALATNIWTGWVTDMIPLQFRGRFFASRTRVATICGLIAAFIASSIVDKMTISEVTDKLDAAKVPGAILLVYVLAVIVGISGLVWMVRQPDRAMSHHNEGFRDSLKKSLKDRNFLKLLFFGFWWAVAIGTAAPFWAPFMMKTLKMSMIDIQIYSTCSLVGTLTFIKFWGRFIDRHGNKPAAALLILISALNPIPWILATPDTFYILYIEGLSNGVMWGGFGIVATNFVMSVAPKGKHQLYSGIYAALPSIGSSLAMYASGELLPYCDFRQFINIYPEQVQFTASALLRFSSLIPLYFVYEKRASSLKTIFKKRN